MSEDMSEIVQKMSEMLKNNEIPDNVKSILDGFTSNQNNSSLLKKTLLMLRIAEMSKILLILLKCLILI